MFFSLVDRWHWDPDYSHGFLILPISLFIVWRKRGRISSIGNDPAEFGLPVLIFGCLLYILSTLTWSSTGTNISFLMVLGGLLLWLTGREMTTELLFPWLYLVFLFPFPDSLYNQITLPLKLFASRLSMIILSSLGVSAVREGNVIYLPNLTMEVATACSGLRSLISLMALGAIFSYLHQKILWKRAVLFLFTIPIAIAANIARISLTGVLSHLFGREMAEGFFHKFSGITVFAFSLILLAIFGAILKGKTATEEHR